MDRFQLCCSYLNLCGWRTSTERDPFVAATREDLLATGGEIEEDLLIFGFRIPSAGLGRRTDAEKVTPHHNPRHDFLPW